MRRIGLLKISLISLVTGFAIAYVATLCREINWQNYQWLSALAPLWFVVIPILSIGFYLISKE